jgi:hypothetical protein
MVDILQILQQFLCYGNSNCINLFNQYSSKPMEGLFYVVFFPILFIVLFIFLIARAISPNKGFRALISVAVFAFIILQGWYYLFATLGQFWLYLLIFLGFIWILVHTFIGEPKQGGGGGGRGRSFGKGFGGKAMQRAWVRVSGQEPALVKAIEADMELLSKMNPEDKEIGEVSGRVYQQLQQLYSLTSVGGLKVGKEYDRLLKRYHGTMKKMHLTMPGPDLAKAA